MIVRDQGDPSFCFRTRTNARVSATASGRISPPRASRETMEIRTGDHAQLILLGKSECHLIVGILSRITIIDFNAVD